MSQREAWRCALDRLDVDRLFSGDRDTTHRVARDRKDADDQRVVRRELEQSARDHVVRRTTLLLDHESRLW